MAAIKLRSASMMVLLNGSICPLHCAWTVLVNKFALLRIQHLCWENLDVNWNRFSERSHCSSLLFQYPIVYDLICNCFYQKVRKQCRLFASLKKRLVATSRYQFPCFVVRSRPNNSKVTSSSRAVAGNSSMPHLFCPWVPFFCAAGAASCNWIEV